MPKKHRFNLINCGLIIIALLFLAILFLNVMETRKQTEESETRTETETVETVKEKQIIQSSIDDESSLQGDGSGGEGDPGMDAAKTDSVEENKEESSEAAQGSTAINEKSGANNEGSESSTDDAAEEAGSSTLAASEPEDPVFEEDVEIVKSIKRYFNKDGATVSEFDPAGSIVCQYKDSENKYYFCTWEQASGWKIVIQEQKK